MSTQPQPVNRPIPGVLYGITHSLDGELIIREPKVLKVGIGLPKGPALNAWMAPDGTWRLTNGYKEPDKRTISFATKKECEAAFWRNLPTAKACHYPRKIPFFTFSKPTIQDGKEIFVPDFDAIEAHGPAPTEIDIVLLDDSPFSGAYQMWSSSELRCKGDGVNAMRLVTLATAEEKPAADAATAAGEKYFPLEGCWTGGCPYSKETLKDGKPQPSACKPGGDLKFQLAGNIRVGGTAYFHTTGYRSISSIFSSLHQIQGLTGGRLRGIPLKMVLRPFRSNHDGQAATQYFVALEFRAPDVETLRRKLLETVFEFRRIAGVEPVVRQRMIEPPAKMLESAATVGQVDEEADDDPPIGAEAMAAEFYPEGDGETGGEGVPDGQPAPAASAPAAAATQEKTAGLVDKMRQSRSRSTQDTAVAASPAAPTTVAAAALGGKPEDIF